MLTVHHLNKSRSQRILWALEELGVPYNIVRYERQKNMLAPDALKKIHPLGKSPVVEDNGFILAESGAILEYLQETYDTEQRFKPHDAQQKIDYRFWLHYAEGSLMPPLLLLLVLGRIPLMGKAAIKRVQPMLDRHLDYVEAELARRPWFAGDQMTAADIMMSFPLEAARKRGGLNESRPATMAWLNKIHARPAYQAALAKGGPYTFA